MLDPSHVWDALICQIKEASPSVKASLIGAVATALSAGIATIVVFKQIGRQAQNAIKQKKHDEALKLKLDLYKDQLKLYHAAADAVTDLSSFIRLFEMSLVLVRIGADGNRPWPTPRERYPHFLQLQNEASRRWIDAIFLIEDWICVDPRIDIFRIALAAADFDISQAMTAYQNLAMTMMPTTKQGATDERDIYPWIPPPSEAMTELKRRAEVLLDFLGERTCYLIDFRTEMQNLLVSELFGHRAPFRQPIDPRHKVIQLERHEDLKRYFEEETDFGRNQNRVLNEVRNQFSS